MPFQARTSRDQWPSQVEEIGTGGRTRVIARCPSDADARRIAAALNDQPQRRIAMTVPCFVLLPKEEVRRFLRRYASGSKCSVCEHGYHQARVEIERAAPRYSDRERDGRRCLDCWTADEFAGDPRWPSHAPCGHIFADGDAQQVFQEQVYIRQDTGEETTLRDAPPGAMWDAWWMPWKGPDGRSLMVRCPDGHDWLVDGRASNCTMPDDDEHRCWVRHGEWPAITVDKNGQTCGAGAGSIQTPKWHGFLRDGVLVA